MQEQNNGTKETVENISANTTVDNSTQDKAANPSVSLNLFESLGVDTQTGHLDPEKVKQAEQQNQQKKEEQTQNVEVEKPQPEQKKADPAKSQDEFERKEKELAEQQRQEVENNKVKPVDFKTQDQNKPKSRADEYKEFTPEEVSALKKLPNNEYKLVADKLRELKSSGTKIKELETKLQSRENGDLPSSYFTHPQGYVLDPKFNALNNEFSEWSVVENHWRQQLILIRENQEWQTLKRDANGQLVLGDKRPATSEAETSVEEALRDASSKRGEIQNRARTMIENHGKRYQQDIAWGKTNVEDAYFPAFSDENLNKPENKQMLGLYNNIMQAIPEQYHAAPSTKWFAKACLACTALANQLSEAKKASSKSELIQRDNDRQQPTREKVNGGSGVQKRTMNMNMLNDIIGD